MRLPVTRYALIILAGEAIEVSGPAGTGLTGWQIVLYNGSTGDSYNTATLSGTIPATGTDRGVAVQSYPSNGIQNGSPDGEPQDASPPAGSPPTTSTPRGR